MPAHEYVVSPEGELDIASVPPLRDQWLQAVADEQPDVFVVDLRLVTYLDSTALGAIVAIGNRQQDHDGHIIVTNANPRLARLFRLTGLDGLLERSATTGGRDEPSRSAQA